MEHRYVTLGSRLRSDRALPGLRDDPTRTPAPPHLELICDARAHERALAAHDERAPAELALPEDLGFELTVTVAADEASFALRYFDGCAFVLEPKAARVVGRPSPDHSDDYFATYLTGPVLAFGLRLSGASLLHAAAVELNGRVIAVTGSGGAGKSTLTAGFARAGHVVLGDDLVGLANDDDGVRAHPGPARIRLWEESAAALFPGAELPVIAPDWDKRFADERHGVRFAEGPRPLAAVPFLEGGLEEGELSEPLPFAEAASLLAASVPAPYLATRATKAAELARMAAVAERVPVRRLGWGAGLEDLSPLLNAVERANAEA
jgi:hypothetical protein